MVRGSTIVSSWLARAAVAATLTASSVLAGDVPSASDFEVHSISVNHDLGASQHQTSQLHLVQQPSSPASSKYFIGLSPAEAAALSWSEVNLKFGPGVNVDQRQAVELQPEGSVEGATGDLTHLFSVDLPENFLEAPPAGIATPNITIAIDMAFHHLSEPMPKTVGQKEEASYVWQGDSSPRTPYGVKKVRVKAIAPSAKIHSSGLVPARSSDTGLVSTSGMAVTFGPQNDVRPIAEESPRQARVHYAFGSPSIGIATFDRHVEVSHWGDNLAIEDKIWLRNDGPALKGHFSRADHQLSAFYGSGAGTLLTDFAVHLPPGARDAYFIDQIGNVSSSIFRPKAANSDLVNTPSHLLTPDEASLLHLQPRYPLVGGWNYTFSIGWNLNLGSGGWGRHLPSSNAYSVAVPFWNAIRNAPVSSSTVRIVLPEGAKVLSVETPFDVDSMTHDTFTTYLDTKGRPAIVLTKAKIGERHAENVFITYQLDTASHLTKPFAVSAAALLVFAAAAVLRRVQGQK